MTRLFCAVLMVFIYSYSNSQGIPAKRLIIQLSHELAAESAQQLCTEITLIIGECTLISKQDSRWLVKIPAEFSQTQIDLVAQKIAALNGVSFAEEDRVMKPLTKPPKTLP